MTLDRLLDLFSYISLCFSYPHVRQTKLASFLVNFWAHEKKWLIDWYVMTSQLGQVVKAVHAVRKDWFCCKSDIRTCSILLLLCVFVTLCLLFLIFLLQNFFNICSLCANKVSIYELTCTISKITRFCFKPFKMEVNFESTSRTVVTLYLYYIYAFHFYYVFCS